jgi:NhaP-type Na+/H+ or K+/H+ antiporter
MHTLGLAALALFILVFGLVSKRIQTTPFTAPMAFVLFGLLVGHDGLDLLEGSWEAPAVRLLAELTLALVLFTDAARIDLTRLRHEHNIPVRLLAVGLPLTILAGLAAGLVLLGELSVWEALVLAVVLAPTDAALGQAVVSSPRVPVRIRQALNVESGLNDGIALPILLFAVSLATAAAHATDAAHWVRFAALQVGLGPLIGIAVGFLGGRAIAGARRREWMSGSFERLAALGLALLAWAGAELAGGNGFIAAFAAGLTLGNTARPVCACLYEFAEAEGQLLTLLSFVVFGAVMVGPALDVLTPSVILYVVASLTVVRMVPVALSLLGLRLMPETTAFLGWFGPRGIASILYGLLILESADLPHRDLLYGVTMLTVLASVFVHGATAWPGVRWYGRWADQMRDEPEAMPELVPVSEMPVRLRHEAATGP